MTELPISLVAPVRISNETPTGVFYPHKPSGIIMLALRWEEKPYILNLTGDKPFTYAPLQPGYSARGTIVADVEFIVDLNSRYDAVQESDPLGALILQEGKPFINAHRLGDAFGDPTDVPLWGDYNSWTAEEKVGFASWRITARDGSDRVTLWSSPKKQAVSE